MPITNLSLFLFLLLLNTNKSPGLNMLAISQYHNNNLIDTFVIPTIQIHSTCH